MSYVKYTQDDFLTIVLVLPKVEEEELSGMLEMQTFVAWLT